ncbi:MAG: hypothetical protein ACXV3C_05900 [Actinomycetes bacterium]
MSFIRRVPLAVAGTSLMAAGLVVTPVTHATASPGATPCSTPGNHNKAQIEHCELQDLTRTKAQIEHDEALRTPTGASAGPPTAARGSTSPQDGSHAADWELALSALAGAVVTGGALAGTQRRRTQGQHV